MTFSIEKQTLWRFEDIRDMLRGNDIIVEMLRNSRAVVFNTTDPDALNSFIIAVAEWAEENIDRNLCAYFSQSEHKQIRFLFEDKADLAKFILRWT